MFFATKAGIYLKKKDKKLFLPKAAPICAGTCGAARPCTHAMPPCACVTSWLHWGTRGEGQRPRKEAAQVASMGSNSGWKNDEKYVEGKLFEWIY